MIAETHGLRARFACERNGSRYYDEMTVIAWDDEGNALVAEATTGKLVTAASRAGFVELVSGGEPLGVVPGNGWRVTEKYPDGSTTVLPVVAWSVSVGGFATPIVDVGDGLVAEILGSDWAPIAPGHDAPIEAPE